MKKRWIIGLGLAVPFCCLPTVLLAVFSLLGSDRGGGRVPERPSDVPTAGGYSRDFGDIQSTERVYVEGGFISDNADEAKPGGTFHDGLLIHVRNIDLPSRANTEIAYFLDDMKAHVVERSREGDEVVLLTQLPPAGAQATLWRREWYAPTGGSMREAFFKSRKYRSSAKVHKEWVTLKIPPDTGAKKTYADFNGIFLKPGAVEYKPLIQPKP